MRVIDGVVPPSQPSPENFPDVINLPRKIPLGELKRKMDEAIEKYGIDNIYVNAHWNPQKKVTIHGVTHSLTMVSTEWGGVSSRDAEIVISLVCTKKESP